MVVLEILKVALENEKKAVEAYTKLIADNPAIKDLLYYLLTEEQKHVAMIEKKISELYR